MLAAMMAVQKDTRWVAHSAKKSAEQMGQYWAAEMADHWESSSVVQRGAQMAAWLDATRAALTVA